jgi:hypothetical protein
MRKLYLTYIWVLIVLTLILDIAFYTVPDKNTFMWVFVSYLNAGVLLGILTTYRSNR